MKVLLDEKSVIGWFFVCFAMRINLLFVCLKISISESSVFMFVEYNLIKNIKIFILAFTFIVVFI